MVDTALKTFCVQTATGKTCRVEKSSTDPTTDFTFLEYQSVLTQESHSYTRSALRGGGGSQEAKLLFSAHIGLEKLQAYVLRNNMTSCDQAPADVGVGEVFLSSDEKALISARVQFVAFGMPNVGAKGRGCKLILRTGVNVLQTFT